MIVYHRCFWPRRLQFIATSLTAKRSVFLPRPHQPAMTSGLAN